MSHGSSLHLFPCVFNCKFSVIVIRIFSNIIVFKDIAEGNSKESPEKQAVVPCHSYCMQEAEAAVPVINVGKQQEGTAVVSAYVLLHVR